MASGRQRWFRALQGECSGPRLQFSRCTMPLLPVGARVRLVVHGFADPNLCDSPSQPRQQDYSCLGNLDRIGSIEVAGRRLDDGWGNSSGIAVLYGLVAAGVFIVAINGWQVRRIPLRTAAIYAFLAATCIFSGFAYF